ncbi:MAG: SBBP repeat-containing protein [Acidobacteriota bacterium]|nr:SBBP repeat-containing protein [Acidobacteriota bacterium]
MGSGPDVEVLFKDRGVDLRRGNTRFHIAFRHSQITRISGFDPLGAKANYLRGSDPGRWRTDLPLFRGVRYTKLWAGVDVDYIAAGNTLKAEYVVAPEADPEQIALNFSGDVKIQADGSLRLTTGEGVLVEEAPVLYQLIDGKRMSVEGGFKKRHDGSIGFWTGRYRQDETLVIDPALLMSGYFGGSRTTDIAAVAIDSIGNIVVAGWTAANDLPGVNGVFRQNAGDVDAFVASFLPNGGSLLYCTYLGGSGDDRAFGLATDPARNVYLTGWTSSSNFPAVGAFQSHLSGTRDAFVTKLNPQGNVLLYSSYLGGSGTEVGNAIGVDSTGAALVVGDTTSTNLKTTSTALQKKLAGAQDVFVARLAPAGNTLMFLTYLGGSGVDHGTCVYMAPGGTYYIGGSTYSSNFPIYLPYQAKSGGGEDGFYAKISVDGSFLALSSYLGGSGGSPGAPEKVTGIYRDGSYVVVAGTTSSSNFPVTAGAYQTSFGGATDGFIARFLNGNQLVASTFLGGASNDEVTGMVRDFHGTPYLTGTTLSSDFPIQTALRGIGSPQMHAFVVKFTTSLSSLLFGTYLGGSGNDAVNAIAVDNESSIVVAGQTTSGDFPAFGGFLNSQPSPVSAFITKIAPSFTLGVSYPYQNQSIFVADPWHVSSYLSSTAYGTSTDLPIVGDWNATGKKQIGIFRNGAWYLDTNGNGVLDAADKTIAFGQAGDIPVVGDWRGTGRIALGLFRQGTFILDFSGHLTGVPTGLSDATFSFGQGGDLPIVADWSGTGTTKVGVFRNGLWLVDYNGDRVYNGLDRSYVYGQAGDIPVVGDWDSSGNPPKIGIFRNGLWILDYDGDNAWTIPGLNEMSIAFGFAGNTPLVF